MLTIEELKNEYKIPIVEIEERNYWLVRTQSGEYHDEFYFDNYIAIGWNHFNEQSDFEDPTNENYLKKKISEKYPDSKQPGLIYNQIKRFFTEINIGDIVMIPTHNSTHISFGKVVSRPFIEKVSETDIEEGACPFQKRMKVEWIKTVKRANLDPYLYRMLHSHHTINNANDYANYIDRTLHSFYYKNGVAHLVMKINKKGDIRGLDFFEFGYKIINLASEVKKFGLAPEDADPRKDIKVKSNVQSPGIVEFISNVPTLIFGIGLLLTFLVGGKLDLIWKKEEKSATAESKGLVALLIEYQKQKSKDEIEKMKLEHRQSMERLKAELPAELKNLPEESQEDK